MTLKELILESQKLTLSEQIQLIISLFNGMIERLFKGVSSSQPKDPKSILDRMGGLPQYFLEQGHLSDRDDRRAAIEAYLTIVRTLYNLAFPHPLPKKGEGEPD